jgi:hypothetical protein
VIGIPLYFFVGLRRNRDTLASNVHTKFRYSTLLVGYRHERYYWEVVVSLRKGTIVAISVFLLQMGPRVQTLVAQALTAILLLIHTHFEPFVPVTKHRNPLHHGDFFALVTAFLTLTAGIYLFQNVGESKGFQTFLVIIVLGVNICYVCVTIYWYIALRLVDMENSLVDTDENQVFTARLVMFLQKCFPDWRNEANLEEIEETNRIQRTLVHNVNVKHVLAVKRIAQKWRAKSLKHAFEREANELETAYQGDQLKLVQKLERLRQASAIQIKERINKRKRLREQMNKKKQLEDNGNGDGGEKSSDNDLNHDLMPKRRNSKAIEAEEQRITDLKMKMPKLILEKHVKLSQLGFQLSKDYKGRVAVRSIKPESTAYKNGIRDGHVLRYIGDFDTQQETLNSVVRILKTQPKPMALRFEKMSGGVAAIKAEGVEEDDPDMI